MRYKLLTNALLVLGISLLFILPTILNVQANTNYPKKIDLVNQIEFIGEFDSQHCEIDEENNRLFLSHQGLKIYNISDPKNLTLLHESSYEAHGKIKYRNGCLFTIIATGSGQKIRVFTISPTNELVYVNESEPFDWTTDPDFYVNEMVFTNNNLLFTFAYKLRCWDISDLNNISCLFSSSLADMFLDYPPTEAIDFSGVAFHPNETKMLITGNYRNHPTGEIKLFDYSNPSNITRIDFSTETFDPYESTIIGSSKDGIVSNGYYPCFSSGSSVLEVMNWTNASQPVFGSKFRLPSSRENYWKIKLTSFKENQIFIYNIISGIVDFSDLTNIKYLTEYDGYVLNFEALREPQIMNDYIYFLEDDYVHEEGHHYYLSIYEVNDANNDHPKNKNLAYLAFLGLLLIIPIVIIIKRK
ncbi:MAG: hypothetical protein ACTSSK_03250 [Candidatus Heimdallarchaeota archaeon]